jgi:hypothetical protein
VVGYSCPNAGQTRGDTDTIRRQIYCVGADFEMTLSEAALCDSTSQSGAIEPCFQCDLRTGEVRSPPVQQLFTAAVLHNFEANSAGHWRDPYCSDRIG